MPPFPSRRALAASLFVSAACGDATSSTTSEPNPANASDACDVIVSDDDCDSSLAPLVFVHGTFGSGDNFALPAALFGSNGYCQDRIVAVEYNSVTLGALGTALQGSSAADPVAQLIDAEVDAILAKTGAEQVVLLGHSQGTGHCASYLADADRAAKVARYINLSGDTTVPNDVPTLSISSENDLGGAPHHAVNAEQQITLKDEDHMGVASSPASFAAIYEYLVGSAPKHTRVQCGDDEVTIEGLAETFGDNVPITGGKLEVFELGGDPQARGEPVLTVQSDDAGHASPFKLKRLVPYEFRATDGSGKLVGHAYFQPFRRSNRLARFLAPSTNPLVSSLTTDRLARGPGHAAAVFRNAAGSFRFDLGDSLKLGLGSQQQEVLADDTAGRTKVTVGLFVSDQNGNQQTELGSTSSAPFVQITDVYIPAAKPAWVHIDWNGYAMHMPNWPSDQGLISVFLMEGATP